PQAPPATPVVITSSVEDDEYEQLFAALNPTHKQVLAKIAAGAALRALEDVARQQGAPLDLLIEQINELALDTMGDNIIDAYEEPPVLIDEHRAGVEQALQNQLAEGTQVD